MFSQLSRLKVYIANSAWILVERFASLGVSFFVTVIVARYLGPEAFGVLAYAISLMSLFAISGHMGLHGIVVRELVKRPDERTVTLGSAFGLKFIGYLVGFLILLAVSLVTEEPLSTEFWVTVVVAAAMLLRPFDIVDFWFQAHVQAKYPAIARLVAHLAASAFKLIFVVMGAPLLAFASMTLVQATIVATVMLIFYQLKATIKLSTWRFAWSRAKGLISQSWLVFFGSIFAVIYLKIDQVMLKWMAAADEVGIYAVAVTLSEAWYFVPTAIVASVFPRLIQIREEDKDRYHARLQQVFDVLFLIAFFLALGFSLVAEPVITIVFGQKYVDAAPILAIHVWTGLFVFMRAAFRNWILIENLLVFSLVTHGLGALVNVVLNFLLIPVYAGYGAALATLVSYAVSSYFALMVSKRSRPVFWMMTKAMVSPLRYSYKLVARK